MPRSAAITGLRFASASVLLVTYAQLAQKWGMVRLPPPHLWQRVLAQPGAYLSPLLAVGSGLTAYLISTACWLGALNYLPLSRAYAMLGLSYGLVYLSAAALPWYHESFSLQSMIGVALIALGVTLVNRRYIDRRKAVTNLPSADDL